MGGSVCSARPTARPGHRKDDNGQPILAPVHVFCEPIPEKDHRPYDLRLLHATLRLLEAYNDQPIDEGAVSGWLDQIYNEYAGDYAQDWQREYDAAANDFQRGVLRSLVAFNADTELEKLFYAAFESIEVLPQRFEQEYFELMSNKEFIKASELMVTIAL